VGGAERSARKRRQSGSAGAKAVAAARTASSDRNKVIITVVAVVVLAAAVIGGVLYTNSKKNTTEGVAIAPKAPTQSAEYPVRRDGALVIVGKDDAKVKLDVYEDFLCPACGAFEARDGAAIEQKVKDGTVQVRYHMLSMLNDRSDPPGYSLDSANAGLCAADGGQFPGYHVSLFNAQPEEGARGYDKGQLIKLGQDLGLTSQDFVDCVTTGRYNALVEAEFEKTRSTPYLQQDFPSGSRGFGTPTIAVGERVIDPADPNWLENLVSGG
jgi:protein-disulfide isomerase